MVKLHLLMTCTYRALSPGVAGKKQMHCNRWSISTTKRTPA